ncbi:uncharacterized protein BKA78DRAFT_156709 [Phyllosticta capitalensis]|uniref:uncharacterized protein n=1 Tax=Phyllosticta capitalensis TaxID=121624 RepID=UPI003132189B
MRKFARVEVSERGGKKNMQSTKVDASHAPASVAGHRHCAAAKQPAPHHVLWSKIEIEDP